MKKFRTINNRKSIKLRNIFWIVLFLIVINTIFLFNIFNKKVNPKIYNIVTISINKMINNTISEYSLKEDYQTINNILIINKNKNDEIINIDFNLPAIYDFSAKITDQLRDDLYNLETGKTNMDYYDEYLSNNKNYFVLNVPIGVASDNVYNSSFGPKIPVKIKFIGSILTGVKTKVGSYGINNSLIEVYTNININTLVITPVAKKQENRTFEILIASKIIEGKVPEFYNGTMEATSSVISGKID